MLLVQVRIKWNCYYKYPRGSDVLYQTSVDINKGDTSIFWYLRAPHWKKSNLHIAAICGASVGTDAGHTIDYSKIISIDTLLDNMFSSSFRGGGSAPTFCWRKIHKSRCAYACLCNPMCTTSHDVLQSLTLANFKGNGRSSFDDIIPSISSMLSAHAPCFSIYYLALQYVQISATTRWMANMSYEYSDRMSLNILRTPLRDQLWPCKRSYAFRIPIR